MIFAAYYLDKMGIRGNLKHGNAKVSHKLAYMIETAPGATSNDIIQLAKTIQKMAFRKYNIILQPECELIGFTENPLLNKSNSKSFYV